MGLFLFLEIHVYCFYFRDNTPHTSDDNVNFDIHDALLGNLTNLLKDTFQNTPVYATLGNHDYFPHNQFPDHGNELYNRSFERWKSWIDESNSDTFLKGEYYAKICIGFLREIFYKAMQEIDRICSVTVSMLSRSAVDRGFKTRTG
jgi:hypothetical protein